MLTLAEIEQYKTDLYNVGTLVQADAVGALQLLNNQPVPVMAGQLREVLPSIVDVYAEVASVIAADFFLLAREQVEVTPFTVEPSPTYDVDELTNKAIGFIAGVQTNGAEFPVTSVYLAGAVQKIVAGKARSTIEHNSVRAGVRYKRIAGPNACAFCLFAAAVADVATKEQDKFHDHCNCQSYPEFESVPDPDYYDDVRDQYGTARNKLIADQEAAKAEYIAGGKDYKKRAFFAAYPETAINTNNLVREIRSLRAL